MSVLREEEKMVSRVGVITTAVVGTVEGAVLVVVCGGVELVVSVAGGGVLVVLVVAVGLGRGQLKIS